jgi:hypothetical protein
MRSWIVVHYVFYWALVYRHSIVAWTKSRHFNSRTIVLVFYIFQTSENKICQFCEIQHCQIQVCAVPLKSTANILLILDSIAGDSSASSSFNWLMVHVYAPSSGHPTDVRIYTVYIECPNMTMLLKPNHSQPGNMYKPHSQLSNSNEMSGLCLHCSSVDLCLFSS